MTPSSSIFSATMPLKHVKPTTMTQSPVPTQRPARGRSPRSTPRLLSRMSRPRMIHMLLVPSTIAHINTRATLTQASSAGSRANTPDGVVGVAAGAFSTFGSAGRR